MPNMLNAAQTAEFNDKGFTYARGLFAPDEVKLLTDAMEQDPAVRSSILDRRDGEGRSTRIALWNRAGDSGVWSMRPSLCEPVAICRQPFSRVVLSSATMTESRSGRMQPLWYQ